MKIDFLKAAQNGSIIELGQHSVAVAPYQPIAENLLLSESLRRPDVTALILTDEDHTAPIINEMKMLQSMEPAGSFFLLTYIPNGKHSSEVYELRQSPNLCQDIEKARAALRPVFNTAKLQLMLACFEPRTKYNWHTDDFEAPAVLRPLSDTGTLILSSDEQSSAHAGQGIYVIKEKTKHSSPLSNDRRWIYTLLPVN